MSYLNQTDDRLIDPWPLEPPQVNEPDWDHIMECTHQKLVKAGLDPDDFEISDPYDMEPDEDGTWQVPVMIALSIGEY